MLTVDLGTLTVGQGGLERGIWLRNPLAWLTQEKLSLAAGLIQDSSLYDTFAVGHAGSEQPMVARLVANSSFGGWHQRFVGKLQIEFPPYLP